MTKNKAVVIIPTYNEKENISKLIPTLLEVFKAVENWDLHILVVDDSSPDETGKVVENMSGTHKNVHLFTNKVKRGLGAAYLTGMKHAFGTLDADVVFEMDADFSHDPRKVPEFLHAIDSGADMVLGSRYIKGGSIPADWGLYRKFLSVVGNLVNMVVLTDFRVRDWTTGYRAIKKKVFEAVETEMDSDKFSGYTFQIGFLHKALRKGFIVKEVPIQFVDRTIGKSKLGPEYIKKALEYILVTRFNEIVNHHIFKFAVVGGIGFLITATGSFLFVLIPALQNVAAYLQSQTNLAFLNTDFVATALATECAIFSNFILNNFYTFKDRHAVNMRNAVPKFLQFNFGSLGALVINSSIVGFGTSLTGNEFFSKLFWLVIGTLVAMTVNYLVYSKLIWKKSK